MVLLQFPEFYVVVSELYDTDTSHVASIPGSDLG